MFVNYDGHPESFAPYFYFSKKILENNWKLVYRHLHALFTNTIFLRSQN
jgi:hypothetical protein